MGFASALGFNIAVGHFPIIGNFVISRGAKIEAVAVMATIEN
jgi:hypothetical protein